MDRYAKLREIKSNSGIQSATASVGQTMAAARDAVMLRSSDDQRPSLGKNTALDCLGTLLLAFQVLHSDPDARAKQVCGIWRHFSSLLFSAARLGHFAFAPQVAASRSFMLTRAEFSPAIIAARNELLLSTDGDVDLGLWGPDEDAPIEDGVEDTGKTEDVGEGGGGETAAAVTEPARSGSVSETNSNGATPAVLPSDFLPAIPEIVQSLLTVDGVTPEELRYAADSSTSWALQWVSPARAMQVLLHVHCGILGWLAGVERCASCRLNCCGMTDA
jgi:hypothetical protein